MNTKIFTQRQIECIYCAAQGLNSNQTGMILQISKRTVESILEAAFLKPDCTNKYQLVHKATKYGFIVDEFLS
jgi:DNA-binding CsgD family transcriptional regulator